MKKHLFIIITYLLTFEIYCQNNYKDTILYNNFYKQKITIKHQQNSNIVNNKNINFIQLNQNNIFEQIDSFVFNYYKKSYPDYKIGWTYTRKITEKELVKYLPKPENAKALKSYYKPEFIILKENLNSFNIYYSCTWDEEHGLGVQIKNGKVFSVSHGSIVYE